MGRRIEHDGRGTLQVRFPFDRGLVDRIKSLPQRRWNASGRFWSVPETDVVRLIDLLRDEDFHFDDATREIYRRTGGSASLDSSALLPEPLALPLFDTVADTAGSNTASAQRESDDYTVSGLNLHVQQVIQAAFPSAVWVIGEISGFNKSAHRKHVGFQLVELDDDGRKVSEVSATLFEATRREIERSLARAGDPFKLEDEITVRMSVRIELYVPWGSYRVIVERLDIHYTLGEAARRREEIIRHLTTEGLTKLNPALPIPAPPLQVGLITSIGSDAFNDVIRTLQESGYAFRVTAHGARVQGRQTEHSILNALDHFRDEADRFDVVLICRGGGSRTDLAWFDSELLGRAVSRFPLPIIIGIGHEQDHSVLDAVARRAKTPTAAAGRLVQVVRDSVERVERTGREILGGAATSLGDETLCGARRARRLVLATRHLLERERAHLDQSSRRASLGARGLISVAHQSLRRWTSLVPRAATLHLERRHLRVDTTVRSIASSARQQVSGAGRDLRRITAQIGPRADRAANRERIGLDAREHRLRLVDPRRVVERGYSILRSDGGRIVTDADAVGVGESIEAELRRGRLRLTATGPVEMSDGEETDE